MEKLKIMKLTYDDIFKHSEIFNPISQFTLFSAGNLVELRPEKTILDLGSGKGFPSLFWASIFGAKVDGYERKENYVKYANARAKMLLLSKKVKYYCKDIRDLSFDKKYDVIAFLGIGAKEIYGNIKDAFKYFQTNLTKEGFLLFSEPFWLEKPVPSDIQEVLGTNEDMFLTRAEMVELMSELDFQIVNYFVSSKTDWELYVKPINVTMQEIIKTNSKIAEEAKVIIQDFKAEYEAVGKYWNMILWVLKKK
jgi:SAM-dependent methyltransferase